ncbi:GntR family transcriptional regulator, partial [Rhodoplanes roseus]
MVKTGGIGDGPDGGTAGGDPTLATRIVATLRQRIISGEIAPLLRLRVRQLAQEFGTGLSPVREALNRLTRDDLVAHSDQRGFVVSAIGEQDLEEMIKARCWLNERALRESIAQGGPDWEERLIVAYHRLSRLPRWADEAEGIANPEWEVAHRVFHRVLIDACGSRWLVGYCEQLFDVADRYRHMARKAALARVRDEHRQIMEAAVARDAERAVELLNGHFRRTAELCKAELQRRAAA